MRYTTCLLLLFLARCASCDDSSLTRVCGQPEPCTVDQSGKVVIGNMKPRLGECKIGMTVCADPDLPIECEGYVDPVIEVCNGLDDDCDGSIDENFDADADGFTICGGDCDDEDPTVYPGAFEACGIKDNNCDGVTKPANPEVCNGIDDDCDGEIDEVQHNACGPDTTVGACKKGDLVCFGTELYCVGVVYPQAEICDNIDNNCDGIIDEALERQCATACGRGIETCVQGNWGNCDAPMPAPEICDGEDNDCNGLVDDGIECLCRYNPDPIFNEISQCRAGVVICGLGIAECQPDGQWGPCQPFSTSEERCNGWDDDCDGVVDGMVNTCGDVVHAGHGVCKLGKTTCINGEWSNCVGSITPTTEICNKLDDDCDGEVDEDLNPHEIVDIWFNLDGSGSMCGRVTALRQGLANYLGDFQGTQQMFGAGVYPGSGTFPLGLGNNVDVISPLTDIATFITNLANYDCNYNGIEPGWSAMFDTATPGSYLQINWRLEGPIPGTPDIFPGAWPYIIMIGDETPNQSLPSGAPSLVSETQLAMLVNDCWVGACEREQLVGNPAKYETFVITNPYLFSLWDEPTYFELDRLIEIDPANAARYTEVLRGIFRNVCR